MRWGWITLRGLWPALLLMVFGTALAVLMGRAGSLGGVQAIGRASDWVFAGSWLAAAVWIVQFALRLKRWEAGDGPFCRTCAGPTGFVKPGRVHYGKQLSDFRRCYNCGNPTPEL